MPSEFNCVLEKAFKWAMIPLNIFFLCQYQWKMGAHSWGAHTIGSPGPIFFSNLRGDWGVVSAFMLQIWGPYNKKTAPQSPRNPQTNFPFTPYWEHPHSILWNGGEGISGKSQIQKPCQYWDLKISWKYQYFPDSIYPSWKIPIFLYTKCGQLSWILSFEINLPSSHKSAVHYQQLLHLT